MLGIPVYFETNAIEILDVLQETFGLWASLTDYPELVSRRAVRARFLLQGGDEGPHHHAPLTYRMPQFETVILETPGSHGVADATRREVVARVTEDLVGDRAHFRYGVVEALTLALLTRFDRLPFHAAAIVRGGNTLLLAGPTGAGKSTLCYVASRAGYRVLTDDAVYLQFVPRLRVWGIPGHLHLPREATQRFPELGGQIPSLLANGKEKVEVSVPAEATVTPPVVTGRAAVCILRGPTAKAAVSRLDRATVRQKLTARLEEGFEVFAEQMGWAIDVLAPHQGWLLDVGGKPDDAIPQLEEMFRVLQNSE